MNASVCSTLKSPQNTELYSWSTIHPLHTLPITNNSMLFCMSHTPVHHTSSTTIIPSSQCRLLHRHCSCDHWECIVVMECITRLHQSSTSCVYVPLWCHLVWQSLCFSALAVVLVVHDAIVLHTHAPHFGSGCCWVTPTWLHAIHMSSTSPATPPCHHSRVLSPIRTCLQRVRSTVSKEKDKKTLAR